MGVFVKFCGERGAELSGQGAGDRERTSGSAASTFIFWFGSSLAILDYFSRPARRFRLRHSNLSQLLHEHDRVHCIHEEMDAVLHPSALGD